MKSNFHPSQNTYMYGPTILGDPGADSRDRMKIHGRNSARARESLLDVHKCPWDPTLFAPVPENARKI